MLSRFVSIPLKLASLRSFSSISKKIDLSKIPKLVESELEETFVRGDGPGGQAVATTNNCVFLRHKPTNFVVKSHGTRSLSQNREAARKLMVAKLDEFYNKEMSAENQRKRLEKTKFIKAQNKSEKLRKLKKEFKEMNKKSDLDKQ